MKKESYNFKTIFGVTISLIVLLSVACKDDVTPSLYSDQPKGDTPVITSVTPPSGLAGVTTITITGQNFSSNAEDNYVFFNAVKATVISASPTELVVKAPPTPGTGIKIKIAVFGVELFSESVDYTLSEAVSDIYTFQGFEEPYSLAVDNNNSLYFSFVSNAVGQGVQKFTSEGTYVNFAPKGGETFFNSMKFGPGNSIFAVRSVRAVFQVFEGQAPTAPFAVLDNGTSMLDLDFDNNLNIWTGGRGGKIYKISQAAEITAFDYTSEISSLRFYDGFLYVAVNTSTNKEIVRFNVSDGNLGTAESYFKITGNVNPVVSPKAITFSADGELFIGTDGTNPMLVVNPDKSFYQFYSDLLTGPILNFVWDNGTNLYYIRGKLGENNQTIIKVNTERLGAPYYGRQ